MTKLADLNAQFMFSGGDGVSDANGKPVPERKGCGVAFDCPCGCDSRCHINFDTALDGKPFDGGRGWKRTGDNIETLTLQPSIKRMDGCGWHGWIRNGETVSC